MILNYIILILIPGIAIAFVAVFYACVLTEDGGMLNGVYKRAALYFKCDEREQEGRAIHWLFKITIGCYKCIAGQWAFWYFMFFCNNYTIFKHAFFVAFTSIMAIKINQWINKN